MTRIKNPVTDIDASGIYYRDLNTKLRDIVANETPKINLRNVHGQRYIGTDLNKAVEIEIYGTPGNDLGAFMNGPKIIVHGNAQDGCGNTMNEGEIIIHGHAGDTIGLSARGGKILVRDDVGYRAGIHMKEYQEKKPVLVIGGTAQDFVGEYMAGGVLILLGLNLGKNTRHKAKFIGTGMHGGVIYLRGEVEEYQLGKEVGVAELDKADNSILRRYVKEWAGEFGYEAKEILDSGDVDPSIPRYIAVSPKQVSDLLNNTTVTSSDYNTVKALAMGEINSFVGFNFIVTNRLGVDGSSNRRVFAWAMDGIKLAVGKEPTARIDERADKSYATQIYYAQTIGATRMEEKKVVEVLCAES